MLDLYWGSLIFGVVFAVVTFIFGDMLDSVLTAATEISFDQAAWLHPMVLVGGITGFGGSGLLLTYYSSFAKVEIAVLAAAIAVALSSLTYFMYVKPMRDCENSTGFFNADLIGRTGEVTVPIPVNGFGEVLIRIGAGNTNQTAASQEQEELPAGTQIVVAQIKEGVLYVYRDNQQSGGEVV
ncbi:MAG: NfeD family protein [Sporomusa sp.]